MLHFIVKATHIAFIFYVSQKMSSKQKKVYLDEIRPWKTAWLIEAKVLHTWKPTNPNFGESLEIVLSDKKVLKMFCYLSHTLLLHTNDSSITFSDNQGCKIHATCKKNYLRSLGEQCNVGEWKTFYNFQVSPVGKNYRQTQHMFKITFINQTVIKPSDFENDDLFLSLATFDSVMSGKLDDNILIGMSLRNLYILSVFILVCVLNMFMF